MLEGKGKHLFGITLMGFSFSKGELMFRTHQTQATLIMTNVLDVQNMIRDMLGASPPTHIKTRRRLSAFLYRPNVSYP